MNQYATAAQASAHRNFPSFFRGTNGRGGYNRGGFVEIGEVVEEDPTLSTVEEEEVFLTKIS
jgi:hypothetical protein